MLAQRHSIDGWTDETRPSHWGGQEPPNGPRMFAQEDHPIAGGEGTGTPQEELTFEFPVFDNE